MKHGLVRMVIGSSAFLEISEDDYARITTAKKNLVDAIFIEEKFDVVIDNYLEFEMELLSCAARQMVHRNMEYSGFQDERNLLNRRLINLLTACRSYIDQKEHHIHNIFGKQSQELNQVKQAAAQAYDGCLGYRVMEALRNYVQHRGYPIHSIGYPIKRVESKYADRLQFAVIPYIGTEELAEDKKFKRSVLEELKQIGVKVDAKPLIREYVASISTAHETLRSIVRPYVQEWEQTLRDAINRFHEAYPDEPSVVGLAAVAKAEKWVHGEPVYLFEDLLKRRVALEKKNASLGTLAKRYVTSEAIKPSD